MILFKTKYIDPSSLLSFIVISIYSLLIYYIFQLEYSLDFPSFYYSAKNLLTGENPYQVLFADHLPIPKKLSANLNPPITLLFFAPLTQLNYFSALIIWIIISLGCGLVGASIALYFNFSSEFFKQNKVYLLLFFLAFFPTLMNLMIGQLGMLILFFIMAGYYFYFKENDCLSGIFWGTIIAIKIFPTFLFVYVLIERRYRTAFIMFFTCSLLTLLPYLIYGPTPYLNYLNVISSALWYGDSWNGSAYGFIFRLFTNWKYEVYSEILIKTLHLVFVLLATGWYLKKTNHIQKLKSKNSDQNFNQNLNNQSFCLAIVTMLLISPLGWVYYFPLLIFPLILSGSKVFTENNLKHHLLWLLSFFLLNFPMDYLSTKYMSSITSKIGLPSFYFYGLLLLAYLLSETALSPKKSFENLETNKALNSPEDAWQYNLLPILTILGFGLITPIFSLLNQILKIGSIF